MREGPEVARIRGQRRELAFREKKTAIAVEEVRGGAFAASSRLCEEVRSLLEMGGEPWSSCDQESHMVRTVHEPSRAHPADLKRGQDWTSRHFFGDYRRNPSG